VVLGTVLLENIGADGVMHIANLLQQAEKFGDIGNFSLTDQHDGASFWFVILYFSTKSPVAQWPAA
jgi:hypothetical protein